MKQLRDIGVFVSVVIVEFCQYLRTSILGDADRVLLVPIRRPYHRGTDVLGDVVRCKFSTTTLCKLFLLLDCVNPVGNIRATAQRFTFLSGLYLANSKATASSSSLKMSFMVKSSFLSSNSWAVFPKT